MLQASVAVHARYAPHITKYWLAFLQVAWLMFDPEIFRIKLTFQACHTRMGGVNLALHRFWLTCPMGQTLIRSYHSHDFFGLNEEVQEFHPTFKIRLQHTTV